MASSDSVSAVRPGTTVSDMVRILSEEVVSGVIAPGRRLTALEIARRFDVSRTPVREALSQLCAMGLAEHRPNRGVIAAEISQTMLLDMFEAMSELEASCARLCARRMTLAERHRLSAMHEASQAMIDDVHAAEYRAFNDDFHSLIYNGSKSQHLAELTAATRDRLAPFRHTQFLAHHRPADSFSEHCVIVEAITGGDAAAAADAARRHVLSVARVSRDYVATHAHSAFQ